MADRGIMLRLIVVLAMAAAAAVVVVRVSETEDESAPATAAPPVGQTPRPADPDMRGLMPTAQEALPGTTRNISEVDRAFAWFECLGNSDEKPVRRTAPIYSVDYLSESVPLSSLVGRRV